MFDSLKNKLKSWVNKVKSSEKPDEKVKKVSVKEPKTKEKKKLDKEIEKSKKKIDKINTKKPVLKKPEKELEKELEQEIEEIEEIESGEKGFFSRFKKKLDKDKFEELFQDLEMILLQNNVAIEVIEKIKSNLEDSLVGKSISEIDLEQELKNSLESVLINPPKILEEIKLSLKEKKPYVILFAGINGSGKTTTIAKFANLLLKNKISVCLAAADTFRAASIEQLQQHADNLKVPLIKKDYNSDPASVGFEAIAYAKKHRIDIVLIDTAGRLQNKDSLMKEMEKIVRVSKPDLKIFVAESITGNDATEQAKAFNNTISIDGIILSKTDIDEKGGTAISVSYVTKKPIFFLGTGQNYEDLKVFDKEKIIENLGLNS